MATVINTKVDWKAMGLYIADRRRHLGMTQSELATVTGRKQPDISVMERGTAQSTVETLVNVAEALGLKPGKLIEQFLKK
jgi:transcriptional regulator with XRE-family HTH domain